MLSVEFRLIAWMAILTKVAGTLWAPRMRKTRTDVMRATKMTTAAFLCNLQR